jgi:hypothetical protein
MKTKVQRIVLQTAEEILAAVKESMVSVLCLCAQKIILFSCQFARPKKLKVIDKLVLVFIIHLGSFLQMAVDILTVW